MLDVDKFTALLAQNSLTILLLHGVVQESNYSVRNYTRKHILAAEFESLLRTYRKYGTPLSMNDVVNHHRGNSPYPPRSFAVTFDDGFENNFSVAAPILADLQVPATFYVTTRFIAENGMSWIDRIEYIVERTPKTSLQLPWEDSPRKIDSVESKISTLKEIRRSVKSTAGVNFNEIVGMIYERLGENEVQGSIEPIDQKMSWAQVRELHSNPLFIVGGHTHSHPILSFLDDKQLSAEITTSLALLKTNTGVTTSHYAYPEGLSHCFDDRVIQCLKENGIVCCPTAIEGDNTLDQDLFHLRRYFVV